MKTVAQVIRWALATSSVVLCLTIVAMAQNAPDYSVWQQAAERAEAAIDADRASDDAFVALRQELSDFRQEFLAARDANAPQIRSVQAQIDALGPVPEGGIEAEDIAAQRAELTEQLTRLRAPVLVAEAAFNRAVGLISEIDRILRDRQAGQLLERLPSPFNPVLWPTAARDVKRVFVELYREIETAWVNPARRKQLLRDLPVVLVLGAVALVLVLRGRRWAEWTGNYCRRLGGRGSGVWGFLISLGRIMLPLAGIVALQQALFASGMVGPRGTLVLNGVPKWGAILLGFWWLVDRVYSRRDDVTLVKMSPEKRKEARLHVAVLAVYLVVADALRELATVEQISDGTRSVVDFVLISLSALTLFRLITIFRSSDDEQGVGNWDSGTIVSKAAYVLRRLAVVICFVAPLIASFGYAPAASALIYPIILSLCLLALLIVLQGFFGDLYVWIAGRDASARESFIPTLIGFFITLAALPVLALIWGARTSDLSELWARFLAGYDLGGTRISPVDFLRFIVLFAIGYGITKLLQSTLKSNLLPKTRLDAGAQNAIVAGTGYLGLSLAAVIAVSIAELNLSSLAIVAGALSVGIGFGLQNIVSNFVSGIILLIERPITEGDWIEVGGQQGYVRDIAVRSTRLETFDRTDVIIPNSDLVSGTVTNYTRGNTLGRVIVPVGVAYGTDTKKVEQILRDIAEAHPMVLATPPPSVVFQGFGADSLDFEIRAILRDVNWVLSVKSDLNHEIAKRFAEEGVEIPFAQRDLWIRNPEALSGKSQEGTS